jgi:hypothetical protein
MTNPNLSTETFPKSDPEIVKLGAKVRDLMTKAMKRAGINAKEVAKQMSERLGGRPITESMIYELTRNGGQGQPREVRLPATWVAAFCEVTDDDQLQRWLAGPRLRELFEQGERLENMESILGQMLDAIGKLKGQGRQKKGKDRRPQRS